MMEASLGAEELSNLSLEIEMIVPDEEEKVTVTGDSSNL